MIEKNLFEKFSKLAKSVKQDFKNKGLIVPTRLQNGDIQVGDCRIVKLNHAYYVRSKSGNDLAGPLNLAQTAILVANDIALGRLPDPTIINNDLWYGYKAFDEQVATNIANHARKGHDIDRAEFNQYKATIAHQQKLYYKKGIDSRYNKLCNLT